MKKVAVVGGGASGLVGAIAAARTKNVSVSLFEKKDSLGKKILATGNGRCNLTNMDISGAHYFGKNSSFVDGIFAQFGLTDTLDFFASLGLMTRVEDGRVYPYSNQAVSVTDVLIAELSRLGVNIKNHTEITSIKPHKCGFMLNGEYFDRVLLSTGGLASNLGQSNGFDILKKLGHTIVKPYPCLCGLKVFSGMPKTLAGVRVPARVSFYCKNILCGSEFGEVQFTAYGLSGIVIFQYSRLVEQYGSVTVSIDLFPDLSEKELTDLLKNRRNLGFTDDYFTGLLNKKLGAYITSLAKTCTEKNIPSFAKLARLAKGLEFVSNSTCDFIDAQVTGGGALTDEFTPNLQSKLHEGLFVSGELLDIIGDCGGYNLQWAWSTGMVAGVACSKSYM